MYKNFNINLFLFSKILTSEYGDKVLVLFVVEIMLFSWCDEHVGLLARMLFAEFVDVVDVDGFVDELDG